MNNRGLTARHIAQDTGDSKTIKECRRAEKSFGKVLRNTEPWAIVLYDYVHQKKEQILGLFEDIDGDQLGRISKEDFITVLRESSAPLPDDSSTEMRTLLQIHEKENRIDYAEFLSGKKYINKKYR